MLNEILIPLSRQLLSAAAIAPVAPIGDRPSRWCQRACLEEMRQDVPFAASGDAAALELRRRTALLRLTGLIAGAGDIRLVAQDIHTLLTAASWSDISAGDPYAFDPCTFDDSFADTACALAAALNLLRDPLTRISPALPAHIESQINRRVLAPFSPEAALPDMTLTVACRLLCAAILGGQDESLRWNAIRRLCRIIDQKLNRLPADGSVPGGIEHAADTAILLMDTAEIIRTATAGHIDLTRHERIVCMADYPLFAHLQTGHFVNPGEHTMAPAPDAESLFRFGHRASDSALCDLSAWLLRADHARTTPRLLTRALNLHTLPALEESPGRIRLFREGFMPDAALMFMRGFQLHMTMTGATHTAHADAGNICLYHRESPILIDIGPGAARTDLHSLPVIGGVGQRAHVPARSVECAAGSDTCACYTANLTAAYPENCAVSDHQRTILMGSASAPGIRLIDMIELSRPEPVDFHFICAQRPVIQSDGVLIGTVLLQHDDLAPAIEPIPAHNCYRLTLHSPAALRHHQTFTLLPSGRAAPAGNTLCGA